MRTSDVFVLYSSRKPETIRQCVLQGARGGVTGVASDDAEGPASAPDAAEGPESEGGIVGAVGDVLSGEDDADAEDTTSTRDAAIAEEDDSKKKKRRQALLSLLVPILIGLALCLCCCLWGISGGDDKYENPSRITVALYLLSLSA